MFRGVGNYIAYNDNCNDFVLSWRNNVWSQQAWRARQHLYCDQPQFRAFGEGFRAGYQDVASGGSGCVPALPPRRFWTWRYQTAEGQAKVAAWFAGFPHGASAAEEEGAGNWRDIQVSHLIEMQYSPEFQRGACPPQASCHDVYYAPPNAAGGEMLGEHPVDQPPGTENQQPLPAAPPLDAETRVHDRGNRMQSPEGWSMVPSHGAPGNPTLKPSTINRWPAADVAYAPLGGLQ